MAGYDGAGRHYDTGQGCIDAFLIGEQVGRYVWTNYAQDMRRSWKIKAIARRAYATLPRHFSFSAISRSTRADIIFLAFSRLRRRLLLSPLPDWEM